MPDTQSEQLNELAEASNERPAKGAVEASLDNFFESEKLPPLIILTALMFLLTH
jgi:hypothetical protein